MPRVEVETLVQAAAGDVYRALSDMERFPEHMADIQSVKVVERGDGYTVSDWVAKLRGVTVRWRERDQFVPGRILYQQISGDLKKFEGEWRIEEVEDLKEAGPPVVRVVLVTEFEFGVPMLAALLNPIGAYVLRDNARSMLAALGALVDAAAGGTAE